jgi:thiaminase/transcriptional activator TenA
MSQPCLSDEILEANGDVWKAMQEHRFVLDIGRDRLDPRVFRRYLAYENSFVETAITIFGYLLVKAPGLAEQRWMVGVLKALSEEQISFFHKAFAELGMADAEWQDVDLPMPVLAFEQGMLAIVAHGPYIEGIVAMFAAEWMYWHWCSAVAKVPISDPVIRRWVDLHAAEDFTAQARWLKQQIDLVGLTLDDVSRKRVARIFRRALLLEISFHHAPYGD